MNFSGLPREELEEPENSATRWRPIEDASPRRSKSLPTEGKEASGMSAASRFSAPSRPATAAAPVVPQLSMPAAGAAAITSNRQPMSARQPISGRGSLSSRGLTSSRASTPTKHTRSTVGGSQSAGMLRPFTESLRKKLTLPTFAQFPFDTAKYLKEVAGSLQNVEVARLLPKVLQLDQLLEQESLKRESIALDEETLRVGLKHRWEELELKLHRVRVLEARTERYARLKKAQTDELAEYKEARTAALKEIETDIKEQRLKVVNQMLPRNAVVTAALKDLRQVGSELGLLGAFLEEEKKIRKALKASARFDASRTAESDGGALSYWLKDCAASSFNLKAIMEGSPLRAVVVDLPVSFTKLPHEKRVVQIRQVGEDGSLLNQVLMWAQICVLPTEETLTLAASLHERLTADPSLGGAPGVILWSKDELAEVTRLSRRKSYTPPSCILEKSVAILTYSDITSNPFTAADVRELGKYSASHF